MRITLEPTGPILHDAAHRSVSISIPGDDQPLPQLLDELIIPALLACGFHSDTILSSLVELGNEMADLKSPH